jgi:flavin-binding protein dodecin
MSNSVYKIIELVGTSDVSWEKAAQNAVLKASETLRDLRIAEISKLDMTIKDGKIESYRARVTLSFKYKDSWFAGTHVLWKLCDSNSDGIFRSQTYDAFWRVIEKRMFGKMLRMVRIKFGRQLTEKGCRFLHPFLWTHNHASAGGIASRRAEWFDVVLNPNKNPDRFFCRFPSIYLRGPPASFGQHATTFEYQGKIVLQNHWTVQQRAPARRRRDGLPRRLKHGKLLSVRAFSFKDNRRLFYGQ